MNHTRLVRTPVVDKNGKLTTVHKREDAGDASHSWFPKPAFPSQRELAQKYVDNAFSPCVDRLPPDKKQKLLTTLHPESLPRMVDMKTKSPNIVMFNITIAIDWCAENGNFALFNSLMLLTHEAEERDSEWHRNALHTLNGIESITDRGNPIDFTNADDPRLEGARVLFSTVMKNKHHGYITDDRTLPNNQTMLTFHDPEVGNLIMEHPDRADDIVDLYRDRGAYNPELFAAVLSSSSPAVNDGML